MERPKHIPEKTVLPEPLAVQFENIPERLQSYPQWVVWNYAVVDEEIKKPPFSPKTGKLASVRNPATWGSFQEVQTAYETGHFAGVGIVLTADMGIVGIDIDHCIVDGQIQEEAHRILTTINSYADRSPSDTGIRIMLEGKLPGVYRRRGNIELYEDMRYLTLTGHRIANTSQDVQPRYRELYGLYQRIFQRDTAKRIENTGVGVRRDLSASYPVTRSDEQVLQKALQAKMRQTFDGTTLAIVRYGKGQEPDM